MAPGTVSPARALARLMVAFLAVVVMTLALTINAVGISDPASPPAGAATATAP